MPKSIISYGFMLLGIYYFLFELAGLGMLLGLVKAGKENLPKYKNQIAKIEQKIVPQIESVKPTPNPTISPLPASPAPVGDDTDPQFGVRFDITTPWAKLQTGAKTREFKGIEFGK